MTYPVIWDDRWTGAHGIARFATEVGRRMSTPVRPFSGISAVATPPLAPVRSGIAVARVRSRAFVSPSFGACLGPLPQLLTLHDLIHLTDPAETSIRKRVYYQQVVRPAVRRARLVLTVSESSRRDIVDWSGLDQACVVNIGNGCSMPRIDPGSEPYTFDTHAGILFVGNAKPHKNLKLLLQAVPYLPTDWVVHLVGVTPRAVRDIAGETAPPAERFAFHGRLSDEGLAALYSRVGCLALPSSAEGFGLPALEAAARGTPTSYCTDAVGEVVGRHGVRCNSSDDPQEYAESLMAAVAMKPGRRHELVDRSRRFQWNDVAQSMDRQIERFCLLHPSPGWGRATRPSRLC